jgi:hypothetical protein
VVFGWTECGELSGKDGLLVGGFWGLWILQFFEIYFLGLWSRVKHVRRKKQIQGFFASLRMTTENRQQQTQRQQQIPLSGDDKQEGQLQLQQLLQLLLLLQLQLQLQRRLQLRRQVQLKKGVEAGWV